MYLEVYKLNVTVDYYRYFYEMMANIYIESEQTIIFDDSWKVIAIDKHKYYRRLSGRNMKCVDFIAISNDWGLVMIELKNYHGKTPPKNLSIIAKKKCRDTETLIRVVNKYLSRQWYYRIFFKKLKWRRICNKEWALWSDALEYIDNGKVLRLLDVQL